MGEYVSLILMALGVFSEVMTVITAPKSRKAIALAGLLTVGLLVAAYGIEATARIDGRYEWQWAGSNWLGTVDIKHGDARVKMEQSGIFR